MLGREGGPNGPISARGTSGVKMQSDAWRGSGKMNARTKRGWKKRGDDAVQKGCNAKELGKSTKERIKRD
jgi:hypothetical protein